MGRLTDDMTRLRSDTDALRDMRRQFIIDLKGDVEDIKADVAAMQTGFRNDRDEMAGKLHAGLGEFMSDLKTTVGGMTTGFYSDRVEMARVTKAGREQFVADIQKAVSNMRDEAEAMMSGFGDNHAEMTKNLHAELDGFRSDLTTMMDDMITGFCNNRTEMAGETKATRQEFVANITRMVDDFKQKNAALRAEFAADISGARQAWSEVSPSSSMAETKVDREENETFVPPAKKDPVSKEAATNRTEEKPGFKQPKDPIAAASKKEILKTEENIVRDDLTQIKGIGVGRETQLNNGGIYTFAQLANCTIDKLNEIFGAEGAQLVPMDKLLEKARNLTK